MKIHRSILAAFLAFAASSALAITVPVSEDTSSNVAGTKLTIAAGKAPLLNIGNPPVTLLRFDLSTLPADVTATSVVSARLHFYVFKAKVADDIGITNVTSDWHETDNQALPSIDPNAFGYVPAAQVGSKKFVSVDVTAQIVAILNGGSNFGFALATGAGKKITISSKEGPASGYPAYLDIETNTTINSSGDANFSASGSFGGSLILDDANNNDGNLTGALLFGSDALEGIGSKRTLGGNQFGLDFYTNGAATMSLGEFGDLSVSSSISIDGTNGSFFVNSGFDPNAGTTLMGTFAGKNGLGPQLRFQSDSGSFSDIGQDGNHNFVIEMDDSVRLTITPDGNVGIGTSTPDATLDVNGDVRIGGLINQGSGTGTSETPNRSLLHRRLNTTTTDDGSIVARDGNVQLQRDGTDGGFKLVCTVAASGVTREIAAMGVDSSGTTVNRIAQLSCNTVGNSVAVYTNAQNLVMFTLTFGDAFNEADDTIVTLHRQVGDSYWIGAITATVNQ